jgi:hypothetical protein
MFPLLLSGLRMDLPARLFHEMMQLSLLHLVACPSHDEHSQLLDWLCSHSSKRKSTDSASKSSKRVRCEGSPGIGHHPPAVSDDEPSSLSKRLFESPNKKQPLPTASASPHRTPVPPLPSSSLKTMSPPRSERNGGIAFASPGRENFQCVGGPPGPELTTSHSSHTDELNIFTPGTRSGQLRSLRPMNNFFNLYCVKLNTSSQEKNGALHLCTIHLLLVIQTTQRAAGSPFLKKAPSSPLSAIRKGEVGKQGAIVNVN